MARATFVKKAQKDYPEHGIKKGESYYWWKFRFGGKHFSKTQPSRSQLTQSEFYGRVYDLEDRIAALEADENLPSEIEDIASELRDIASECEDKRNNMPESLQDSDSGQLLEERAQAMESAADEFESIDFNDAPESTDMGDETDEETCRRQVEADEEVSDDYWQTKLEEVQAITIDAP